ncbi:MAG TPA: hypothetical protein VIX41_01165, partial [Acidimicrobiales bacterium]
LTEHEGQFDFAITLDVIGDPEGTWANHHELEAKLGRQVVPVVHFGTPVEWAQRYADEGHTLIALGGIALGRRTLQSRRYRWMHSFFAWGRDHGVVFHGLGIGAFQPIRDWPWFSVDTSNTTSLANRYGRTYIFDPGEGRIIVTQALVRNSLKPRTAMLLRRLGVDPVVLSTERYSSDWAKAITTDTYRRLEPWVRARRSPVTWNELDGLRIYLCAGVSGLPTFMIGHISEEEQWTPAV